MDYRQAIGFLDAHTNLEGEKGGSTSSSLPTAGKTDGLTVGPIRSLMAALGDPHLAYRVIHVTGTNGKGSTTRFAAEILRATDLSVGTFTSPNLERLSERIRWDGQQIPDHEFARIMTLIEAVEPMVDGALGRFDLLTAVAFIWFAEIGVDVAVIEVGMLGRFDSTNIVEPDVAVLTNISKDHTDGAPGWREAIASEKAGIVKPGARVVLGERFGDLRPYVEGEEPAVIWEARDDFVVEDNALAVGGRVVDIRTPHSTFEQLFLPVHGEHQVANLATAIAAVESFFDRGIDQQIVETALDGIELPGRFEIMRRDPTVILDGAHNPDGANAAKQTLDEEFARLGSWILVFGMLQGRDPVEMLQAIDAADFDAVIVTEPDWSRALPALDIAEAAASIGLDVEVIADPGEAFARATSVAGEDDLILVAGSLYLVGAVRPAARSVLDDSDALGGDLGDSA